jgi:hypothetical protein
MFSSSQKDRASISSLYVHTLHELTLYNIKRAFAWLQKHMDSLILTN